MMCIRKVCVPFRTAGQDLQSYYYEDVFPYMDVKTGGQGKQLYYYDASPLPEHS